MLAHTHSHVHTIFVCLYKRRTVRAKSPTEAKRSKEADMREKIIRRAALEFKDGMYGILCMCRKDTLPGKLYQTNLVDKGEKLPF